MFKVKWFIISKGVKEGVDFSQRREGAKGVRI